MYLVSLIASSFRSPAASSQSCFLRTQKVGNIIFIEPQEALKYQGIEDGENKIPSLLLTAIILYLSYLSQRCENFM